MRELFAQDYREMVSNIAFSYSERLVRQRADMEGTPRRYRQSLDRDLAFSEGRILQMARNMMESLRVPA